MNELFTSLFLLVGSFFILAAGIGIVRLPNTLCRAHPLSKAVTLGLSLVLVATLISFSDTRASIKILLAIFFHFITIPIAGHILARYAVRRQQLNHKEES